VLVWGLHLLAVGRALPALGRVGRPRAAEARPILALGGWMTVSNVVSPLMTSLDRFAVGAVLSMEAVAHYTTASEAVMRLWIVTAVVLPVFFPAIAAALHADPRRAARLFDQGARLTLSLAVPGALVLSAFAPEWIRLWVGPEIVGPAAPLAQGLASAVVVNVAGQIAYTLLQAAGRADLTGRLHVAELAPYAGLLWWLLHARGAAGVVIAWTVRVVVDTVVLVAVARRAVPSADGALRRAALVSAVAAAATAVPLLLPSLAARAAYAGVTLAAFAGYGWRVMADADDRATLVRAVRSLTPARRRAELT
jgi:O-antigen/teichoic acid export membrane protein